jgi:YYY domain-containing protein
MELSGVLHFWRREHPFAAAFLVIALGVCLRLTGLEVDAGLHLHPDERFLNMVVAGISWPATPGEYFDTERSPLNPRNHENLSFYVYGMLPVILGKAVGDLTGTGGYNDFLLTGRLLSAVADIGSIVFVFLLAGRFFCYHTGLLAACLYAAAVLPMQLSHFFIVDPFLNLFLLAALYFAMDYAGRPAAGSALLTGLFWGLALATKISGLAFAAVFLVAGVLSLEFQRPLRAILLGMLTLTAAMLTFRLFNPYAFAGPHWHDWLLDHRFLSNLATLRTLSDPFSGYPPSLQWALRTPWIFPLKNMAVWGLGIPLFSAAVPGAFLAAAWGRPGRNRTGLLPVLWALTIIGLIGVQPAQTMRYLLPLCPLAAIFAACCLVKLRERLGRHYFSCWPMVFVVGSTLCWMLAFSSIYRLPHTRVEASRWIYQNIRAGSVLAVENWDDALPLPLPGTRQEQYRIVTMEAAGPDTADKRDNLLNRLRETDYLIVSSNRLYGSATRLQSLFPLTCRYYELLFNNLAGFSLIAEFISYPTLGGVAIPDDAAEEAFTVYDHPRVLIFKKNERFSADFLQTEFEALQLPDHGAVSKEYQKQPSTPVVPLTYAGLQKLRQAEPLFLWRWIVLFWLAGLAGNLVSRRVFPETGLPCRSLVAAGGALVYALGMKFGIWSSASGVAALTAALIAAAFLAIWDNGREPQWKKADPAPHLVFWGTFFLFLFLRAKNPAIFWGERPFDFALLNAMMRTEHLPPIDPWMSKEPLNYHAWGQLFIAFWGRAAHVPPEYVYNLGAALVPALACEVFFWTAKRLTGKVVPTVTGLAVLLWSGNLSAWFLHPWNGGFTFQDFWDASRIVPGTINEFPFWTALFADLHGHYIGMIFSTLFLASSALLLTSSLHAWKAVVLQGFALGLLTLTNPWALPVYLAVFLLLTMSKQKAVEMLPPLFALFVALLVIVPFWSGPRDLIGISWADQQISAAQLFILFGPFLTVYLLWVWKGLEISSSRALVPAGLAGGFAWYFPSGGATAAAVVLAAGLLHIRKNPYAQRTLFLHLLMITGLLVLIGCELFTLYDRMNTVFKFHFEVWILFSLASSLVVRELLEERKPLQLPASAAIIILGTGLLTSACAFMAWWKNPLVPVEKYTLNGLAWLEKENPDEALMVHWLRNRRGQPAIAEASGPPYEFYGRISSFTGLPTVIGWEYHVYQHGHPWDAIKTRQSDLQSLYLDPIRAEAVIEKYHIRYGILGELEKQTYGDDAGSGWRKIGWHPLFQSRESEIWGNIHE